MVHVTSIALTRDYGFRPPLNQEAVALHRGGQEIIAYLQILMKEDMNMQGWTEQEIRTKDLMAPCGLYCGICGVYIATRDGHEKSKTIMANLYGTKPEQTECLGCMQHDPPRKRYGWCHVYRIRD
jgi:hypothetical protein